MLLMHHMDHLSPADSESGAIGNGIGRSQTQPRHRRECLFSYKVNKLGFEKRADFPYGEGSRWIEVASPAQ